MQLLLGDALELEFVVGWTTVDGDPTMDGGVSMTGLTSSPHCWTDSRHHGSPLQRVLLHHHHHHNTPET